MLDPTLSDALNRIIRGDVASGLESETLEFKRDHADGDSGTARIVADEALCLANTRGGHIIIGVDDKLAGSEALRGTTLEPSFVKKRVWDLTRPHLIVDAEVHWVEGVRLLVVRVPESPDIHADTQGRAARRIATECHAMLPDELVRQQEDRRGVDWSAKASDRRIADVSRVALDRARALLDQHPDPERGRLARLGDRDLLAALGVLRDDGRLTRTGETLFCAGPNDEPRIVYVHRPTPGGEPDDVRRLGDPLVIAFERVMELVEARRRITPLTFPDGQQVQLEDFPSLAVRESLSNAVTHRDYHQRASVVVAHAPQVLEVSSPGPLVAGVTPENILTHDPKPRNGQLARVARMLGLAEEVGAGVDRIYREMIGSGKDPPTIESTFERVRVTLVGGAPNTRIPAYLRGLPSEERSDVDTLLVLAALCGARTVDAELVARLIQKPPESAQAVLERLAQDSTGMIEPTRGTARRRHPKYRLREAVLRTLGTAVRYNRRSADELDRKIVAHVTEYGRVTNRTVRNLFDVDVHRARDILSDLVRRQILSKTSLASRGPSVEYGPGERFPTRNGRRR